jgi:hypothetical protein
MEKQEEPIKEAEEIQEKQLASENKNEMDEEKKEDDEFVCNPYTFSNSTGKEVDYDKLIKQFGTKPITKELLDEFERVTGAIPHIYLRRGKLESKKASFSRTETWVYSLSSLRRRSLYTYTQAEGHLVTLCIWVICFLSYSRGICRGF